MKIDIIITIISNDNTIVLVSIQIIYSFFSFINYSLLFFYLFQIIELLYLYKHKKLYFDQSSHEN